MTPTGDAGTVVPDVATVAASQLTQFMKFCAAKTGRPFADDTDFYAFSVAESQEFWGLFLEWSDLLWEGSPDPSCTDPTACESAVFFPHLRLNYVENLLRVDGPEDARRPAVIAHHERRPADRLTRGELRDRVLTVAGHLRGLGIRPGDRVVAVVRNNAEALVAGLATVAAGATFSSVAPEMGNVTILDRFEQLEPRLLIANFAVDDDVTSTMLSARVAEIARALPSLIGLVAIDDGPAPPGVALPVHRLATFLAQPGEATGRHFERFPFNHPLFILFSSGTTGRPKCIIHGAGGTLLEHAKEHRLHTDLRPSDTLFFHTSTAWMMWNWQLSALASGAAIVVYDGPLAGADTLWRVVATERVTVFGTSPPYLQLCADSGYAPREHCDLAAVRAVLSTGSILHAEQYDWIWDHVGRVPVQSISGGTDVIGCFVLGNPNLPVYRGKIQSRSLGLDVRALPTASAPSQPRIGELVCGNPFPSRPLGFVGDDDGVRFHDAYYRENKDMWTHGDLVEIDPSGQVRMHGRSDGVLNIHGARIGPAEIYRVLRDVPEVADAIAIEQPTPEGPDAARLVLLVVLRPSAVLDDELTARIRQLLASEASPAHVPHLVVDVEALPVTHSGKRSERAARDALAGVTVVNAQSLANPGSLEQIVARVARADALLRERLHARRDLGSEPMVEQLRAIWEEVLDVAPLALTDNFFDVGGTSLGAVRLLNAIRVRLGVELPLSTLLHSRTIESMAAAIAADDVEFPLHVLLKPGTGDRPLFIAHGLFGDILQLRTLALELSTDRPVYGLRSRGLDRRTEPFTTVEEMADEFVAQVRRIQPTGPCALAGHSFGGLVAFEMARRLTGMGQQVDALILIDTYVDDACLPTLARARFRLTRPVRKIGLAIRQPARALTWLWGGLAAAFGRSRPQPRGEALPPLLLRLGKINMSAFRRYRPLPYDGHATFVRAMNRDPAQCDPLPVWTRLVRPGLHVESLSCAHDEILVEPHVRPLADVLSRSARTD
jgi:acetoacetyl-CoA synthetase